MAPDAPAPAESDHGELKPLLEAIEARYGCDLRGYAPHSLRRRIALARSKVSEDAHEFERRILSDSELFACFLHDLTVHVSELFRDPVLYRTLRQQVLPVLRTYPQIRIWHAGCATGEEAYASAILLSEEGLYERCQIYATDLSAKVLQAAKEGIYAGARLHAFSKNYRAAGGRSVLANYFQVGHGHAVVRESLKRNILFFQHNLVSDHDFGEMHVIFCRNVMIYFGRELRERVLSRLEQSLCAGGFLCLGESEQLSRGALAGAGARFEALSAAARIYRQVDGTL
jgi:chemotaxis protein methyltransferase CheR